MISVTSSVAEREGKYSLCSNILAAESSVPDDEAAEPSDCQRRGRPLEGLLPTDWLRTWALARKQSPAGQLSVQLVTPELELQEEKFQDF